MSRPDVPVNLARPGASSLCGWSAWVDVARWPPGDLLVRAVAHGRWGRRRGVGEKRFLLVGSGLAGDLEVPEEGAEIARDLIVSGWAAKRTGGAARVEISVEGRPLGLARLRLPRPDIAALPVHGLGPLTGFEFRGGLPELTADTVEIAVTVVDGAGNREQLASRRVRRSPAVITAKEAARAAELRHRTAATLGSAAPLTASARPHLLVFTHSLAIGGGQLYLNELLRHLVPDLPGCTVVSPTDGVLRDDLERLGVDVIVTGRTLPDDVETYEGQVRELALFIRGSSADVVLLNTLGAWPAGDAARRAGVPTIWSIHESYQLEHWLSGAYGHGDWHPYARDRLVATLGAVDRVVFEAAATGELFAPYVDAGRRAVVRYGVDADALSEFSRSFDRTAARRAQDIPDGAAVLLSVGTVEERKSQTCLIEAFAAAAPKHPETRLVIVGDRPCAYSTVLHQLSDSTGLGDRIRILPVTPDIWPWYAMSDLLVSTSDIESLPRSMLEAMAVSTPVLATAVFGVPEVVEDGRTGWLFQARDMAALADALDRVLTLSPAAREAVGARGREIVVRDHRSDGYGAAYREIIDAVIRPRSASRGQGPA